VKHYRGFAALDVVDAGETRVAGRLVNGAEMPKHGAAARRVLDSDGAMGRWRRLVSGKRVT
jgi:hypothetical protein